MSLAFLRALRRDRFFQLLIIVGMALSLFVPFAPRAWPDAIDWHTIITLSGLMLLTKGADFIPSGNWRCSWCWLRRRCRPF